MIFMDSKAQLTVDIIAKVAQGKLSIINAAKLLNKSRRTIERYLQRYQKMGIQFIVHLKKSHPSKYFNHNNISFNLNEVIIMEFTKKSSISKTPWNKGKIVSQKPALKLKEIWGIRIRLQIENNIRELALFNMAIDSKLRGCDLVSLRINDVMHGGNIVKRAVITQQKTKKPVHFEITEQTRDSLIDLINEKGLTYYDFLFKSRFKKSEHLSTRQYALIVKKWVASIGLDPMEYGLILCDEQK